MKKSFYYRRSFLVILILINTIVLCSQDVVRLEQTAKTKLKNWKNPLKEWQYIARPRLDSVKIDPGKLLVSTYFTPALSYYPFREESLRVFNESLSDALGRK